MKEIKDIYDTINTLYNAYFNTEDDNIKKIYKDMYINCIDTLKKIEKKDNNYYQVLLNKINIKIVLPKENIPKVIEKVEYKVKDIKYKDKNKRRRMNSLISFLNSLSNSILTYLLLKLFYRCLSMPSF